MMIDSFEGNDDDWLDYKTKFESAAQWNGWDTVDKLQQLIGHMKGNALALYTDHKPESYPELVELLEDRYVPEGSEETSKMEFWATHLEPNGDPHKCAQKLARLARRAFPKYDAKSCAGAVLDQFKAGIVHPEMRRHVTLGAYKTIREAVLATAAYIRYEENQKRTVSKPSGVAGKPRVAKSTADHKDNGTVAQERQETQFLLNKMSAYMEGHPKEKSSPNNPQPPSGTYADRLAAWRANVVCFRCKKKGHELAACPENKDGSYVPTPIEQAQLDRGTERRARFKQTRGRPNSGPPGPRENEATEPTAPSLNA
jgi:hypothetical protein